MQSFTLSHSPLLYLTQSLQQPEACLLPISSPPPLNCSVATWSLLLNCQYRVTGMHNAASPSFVCHDIPWTANLPSIFSVRRIMIFKWSMRGNLSLQHKFQRQQNYCFRRIEQIYLRFSELSPAKMKTLLLLKIFLTLSSICLAERIQVNNFFGCF